MFTINNETWYIKAVNADFPKLWRENGSRTVAVCDDDTKTIYISNQVKGGFLKKVLCHEITHAAMFSYNVMLSIEEEEMVADIIATYGDEIISVTNHIFKKFKGVL